MCMCVSVFASVQMRVCARVPRCVGVHVCVRGTYVCACRWCGLWEKSLAPTSHDDEDYSESPKWKEGSGSGKLDCLSVNIVKFIITFNVSVFARKISWEKKRDRAPTHRPARLLHPARWAGVRRRYARPIGPSVRPHPVDRREWSYQAWHSHARVVIETVERRGGLITRPPRSTQIHRDCTSAMHTRTRKCAHAHKHRCTHARKHARTHTRTHHKIYHHRYGRGERHARPREGQNACPSTGGRKACPSTGGAKGMPVHGKGERHARPCVCPFLQRSVAKLATFKRQFWL